MVRNAFQYGKDQWRSVSAAEPCPICGKDHNCKISDDDRAVWCGRESRGAIRQNKGGQWLHQINDSRPIRTDHRSTSSSDSLKAPDSAFASRRQARRRQSVKRDLGEIGQYQNLSAQPQLAKGREYWGERWDIPDEPMIIAGAIAHPEAIHICEVDPSCIRKVVTQVTRSADGKLRWRGSAGRPRGSIIYIPDNVEYVIIVEGGSCSLAAIACGLGVVSRATRDADLTKLAQHSKTFPLRSQLSYWLRTTIPKMAAAYRLTTLGEHCEKTRSKKRSYWPTN